jgi:hypothetical protein
MKANTDKIIISKCLEKQTKRSPGKKQAQARVRIKHQNTNNEKIVSFRFVNKLDKTGEFDDWFSSSIATTSFASQLPSGVL